MTRKIGFGLLWLAFTLYAFVFAPPQQPETFTLIKNLAIGNWSGINPLIIALFYLMGVLPLIYACVLLFDGSQQKVPAWFFVAASFGFGVFALLPYLALREPNPDFTGDKNFLLKRLDSRWTGVILSLVTVTLLFGGFFYGDWANYGQQWQTSRFIT